MPVKMAHADAAVLDVVESTLMNPNVVERALAMAEAEIRAPRRCCAQARGACGPSFGFGKISIGDQSTSTPNMLCSVR